MPESAMLGTRFTPDRLADVGNDMFMPSPPADLLTCSPADVLTCSRPDAASPKFHFAGVAFDAITMTQAVERIDELIDRRVPAMVVTANVDHLLRMRTDPAYAELVLRADMVVADGQPIVWASWLMRRPLPMRVPGSDLLPRLCAHAADVGHRVFFLGGDPGAAGGAAKVLWHDYPRLRIVGIHCPPYGFERDPAAAEKALDSVRASKPDIVFVGLGSPKQEQWILANMATYDPAVSIGVGISFSFVAGLIRRAPVFMQRMGMEWFHRLCCEPSRLWRRYLLRGPKYLSVMTCAAIRRDCIHCLGHCDPFHRHNGNGHNGHGRNGNRHNGHGRRATPPAAGPLKADH